MMSAPVPIALPITGRKQVWTFDTSQMLNERSGMNPSNDARIPVSSNTNKINCTSMQVSQVDIPQTQWVIESGINDQVLYREGGIEIDQNCMEFSVACDNNATLYTSRVIPTLNPITSVVRSGPTTVTITTKLPHGLLMGSLIQWGAIELINTCWTKGQIVLGDISILSETIASIVQPVAVCDHLITMQPEEMYVWCPPYPDVQSLVNVIRAGFPPMAMQWFSIDVSIQDSIITVRSIKSGFTIRLIGGVSSQSSNQPSLPTLLGFGSSGNVQEIKSSFPGQLINRLTLGAGNYNDSPTELAQVLEQDLNQYLLKPDVPGNTFVNVCNFTDSMQNKHVITLPVGLYNATMLMASLEGALNLLESDASVVSYTVKFAGFGGQNVVIESSQAHRHFGLDFTQPAYHSFANQFGFGKVSYTGNWFYEAEETIQTGSSIHIPRYQYTTSVHPRTHRLSIHVGYPGIKGVMFVTTSDNMTYEISCNDQTHGLHDKCVITMTSTDPLVKPFKMVVNSVLSATSFNIRSSSYFGSLSSGFKSLEPSARIYLSLLFSSDHSEYGMTSGQTLGFASGVSSLTNSTTLTSPFPMNLFHPSYVLLEVVSPINFNTQLTHAWKGSIKNNLVAKVRLDRDTGSSYIESLTNEPIQFFGMQGITSVHMRILNPDHSLYQLHGKDWSGTIVLDLA